MAPPAKRAGILKNGSGKGVAFEDEQPPVKPDFVKGVWQLARLHTREAWLCWYPAIWGACIAAGVNEIHLDLSRFAMIIFGIIASVTATHCTFCTFKCVSFPPPIPLVSPIEVEKRVC